MDLLPNKTDGKILPITTRRIAASEWNQLVGSCMAFITAAGFTPDAEDNEQLLNAFKAIAASLELVGANTNLSNLTATGEGHFAKPDLSNCTQPYITETWHSGSSWCRVWSDKWCEMGGIADTSELGTGFVTVNFYKEFSAAPNVLITLKGSYYNDSFWGAHLNNAQTISTTGFTTYLDSNAPYKTWEAKGYLTEE